jgi:hypothetical protein
MLKISVFSLGVFSTLLALTSGAQAQEYGPGVSPRAENGARATVKADRESHADLDQAQGGGERAQGTQGEQHSTDRGQAAAQPNPRQRYHNGRWWYLTNDNQWLVYENGRWVPYQQVQSQPQPQYYQGGNYQYGYNQQPYGNRYGSGYRGNYNGGYYGQGNYNGGYYGQQGYYNGPGYGNRGWGNSNYGNRGANQGSNVGGAIGQGLGGSGQIGAGVGAIIGNN